LPDPTPTSRSQPAETSLLDQKATGGLASWGGFTSQVRYILVSLPGWLRMPDFESFQPERLEDVDVFRKVNGHVQTDHHQVKTSQVDPAHAKRLIEVAFERHRSATSGYHPFFVIATPRPHPEVKAALDAVALYRRTAFEGDQARSASTRKDVTARLIEKGIVGTEQHATFALDRVSLAHDWGGLEPSNDGWGRLAGELGQVSEFDGYNFAELTAAIKDLAHHINTRKRYLWTRAEVCSVLRDAIGTYRAGPPRSAGDIIFLCHTSRAQVRAHPSLSSLPDALKHSRVLQHTVEHSELLTLCSEPSVKAAVASMMHPDGGFQNARTLAGSRPLLYYGFPHIPLASLAGYLLGEQAVVHLMEHDRETNTFEWAVSPLTTIEPLATQFHQAQDKGALVVRVSVSSQVTPSLCHIATSEPIAKTIDFSIERPRRGAIVSESQARGYAKLIRESLDLHASSGTEVTGVHVFAAVPVSLAFLIGQIASFHGFPLTFVYNFNAADSPPYRWAVCLHGAGTDGGVHIVRSHSSP